MVCAERLSLLWFISRERARWRKKCEGERKEAGKVSNYPRQLRSRRHAKIVSLHNLEGSAIEEANPVDF